MDVALLIARLVVGLGMAAHGGQKLFGWFGGHGLRKTGDLFASLGFRAGTASALAAGMGEAGGGLLIAIGFIGPVGPALVIAVMTVAVAAVHLRNGFFAMKNGTELPLLYAIAGLMLIFTDFGAFSLDSVVAPPYVWSAPSRWLAAAASVVTGIVIALLRRAPAEPVSGTK